MTPGLRIACAVAAMLLASTVYAQSPGQEVESACAGDIARLCPKVQPGGGRIAECLKAQKAEVSIRCKLALKRAAEAKAAAAQAGQQPH